MVRELFIQELKNEGWGYFRIDGTVSKTRLETESGGYYKVDDFTLGGYVLLTKEEYALVKDRLEEKKE